MPLTPRPVRGRACELVRVWTLFSHHVGDCAVRASHIEEEPRHWSLRPVRTRCRTGQGQERHRPLTFVYRLIPRRNLLGCLSVARTCRRTLHVKKPEVPGRKRPFCVGGGDYWGASASSSGLQKRRLMPPGRGCSSTTGYMTLHLCRGQ